MCDQLKNGRKKRGEEKQHKKHSAVLQSIYGLVCSNSMFESCANVAVNVAIFNPVCEDVCGSQVQYIMNQPAISALFGKERTNMVTLKYEAK